MLTRQAAVLGCVIVLLGFYGCSSRIHPPAATSGVSAEAHFERGYRFFIQKDYPRAVEDLVQATSLKPDFPRAFNILGVAYFRLNDYDAAEENFRRAIALNPEYASALSNLGNLSYLLGRREEARELLRKALSLSPELVSAHFSLGSLLMSMGETEEGLAHLMKGLELDPGFLERGGDSVAFSSGQEPPEAYFGWARLYASTGNVEKTLDFLERARKAGFKEWKRIDTEPEFEGIRDLAEIRKYIRD
jgi:tetratricopeptide (TPR) repeat protein